MPAPEPWIVQTLYLLWSNVIEELWVSVGKRKKDINRIFKKEHEVHWPDQ